MAPAAGRSDLELALQAHLAPLRRTIRYRVGNDDDAAEIVQEACLRLMRYQHRVDLGELRALLYRIALNLVGMRHRAVRQQGGHALSLDQIGEEALPLRVYAPTQEQHLIDSQQLDRVLAAIADLPPRCRQVFILHRFHDMSYRDIAAHCDISLKMVEKHIGKALAVVRLHLDDDGA